MRPIDADKLKKDVLDLPDCYNGFSDTYDKAMILALVDEQPTVEPKHGHWVDMADFESCSICNGTRLKEFQSYYGKCLWVKMDYCPNCGSKMDEVTE